MRPGLYTFAVAAAFLGATIYIGLVEQPARLALGTRAMFQEWARSNRRGTLMLSILAVVSAILAYAQFRTNGDVRWIIGGITILASWPYCLLCDGAGERLALRYSGRKSRLARAKTDARLGIAGMGSRLDRVCCRMRFRVGTGAAGVIDGHQCR